MKKIVGFFGIFALIAGFATSCKEEENKDDENDHTEEIGKGC